MVVSDEWCGWGVGGDGGCRMGLVGGGVSGCQWLEWGLWWEVKICNGGRWWWVGAKKS